MPVMNIQRFFLAGLVALALCAANGCSSSRAPVSSGGLAELPNLTEAQSRSISAENPTGGKGQGGMALPHPGAQADNVTTQRCG